MTDPKVLPFPATPKKMKKRRKYEMADGTFKAKPMINGKRYTIRGKSTKEVEEKIAALKAELQGGVDMGSRNITVEAWTNQWYDAEMRGKSAGYKEGVAVQLRHVCKAIGGMKVRDVRPLHLQAILNARAGMSKSQISSLHGTIRRVFEAARKNRIIVIDPSLDLKKPAGTYTGHRCLESWEINLLLEHWRECYAGVWAVTMMLSGVRRGECVALSLKDFDFDRGCIHVRNACAVVDHKFVLTGKTKTPAGIRDTPMLEPLASIIKEDFANHPRELFVVTMHGGPVAPSTIEYHWHGMLEKLSAIANRPVDFDRHDLRHTFATFLFEADVDEKTAMAYLGHTSPAMTRDLYAHLRDEQKDKSRENLKEYFKRFVTPE